MKSSTIKRPSITHFEKLVIEIAAWLSVIGLISIIVGTIFY